MSRSARASRGPRAERDAAARCRRDGEQRGRPLRAATVLCGSLLAGILMGSPVLAGLRRWLPSPAGPALAAIHVRGATQLSLADIAHASGVAPGTALGRAAADTAARNLLAHPWIAGARALRLPSGDLLVDVVEHEPLGVIETPDGDFFVDADGAVFAPVQEALVAHLPRLSSPEAGLPKRDDSELARALSLARRLPALGLAAPAEVEITPPDDPEGYVLLLADPPLRVILGRDDPDAALARLAELFVAGLPEVAEAAAIDLRFADQAVLRGSASSKEGAQAAAERGGAKPSMVRPTG